MSGQSDHARSLGLRTPVKPAVKAGLTRSELTGPGVAVSALMGERFPEENDLTRDPRTGGEAIGQRIILTGRISDEHSAPVRGTLVEIWQANAAGRYRHRGD